MDIHESVHKVLADQQAVADLFYTRFLDNHPEIRRFFDGVDMKRQAVLLGMTLLLIEHHYVHRYPMSESYLQILGHRHQTRRGIPAWTYGPFRDCLLESLAQFHGAEWDEKLARQWTEAIDLASRAMLAGYDQDISV
jgi:hemoglobin-like flavoprotein